MGPFFSSLLADGEGIMQMIMGAGIVMLIIYFAIILLVIISQWMIFEKAGKPGWASIIPIYNIVVLLEIVGKPIWWVILFLIPCVGIIVAIIVVFELARVFGRGAGTGLGLLFLPIIFYPILAFGSAKYQGPQNPVGM